MTPCSPLIWTEHHCAYGGMGMQFINGSHTPYWQGAEKGWEAGEGGALERTWYVHWIEECKRWMVYSFVAGEEASSRGKPTQATAFTETAEEGKEVAETAHEEAWNKELEDAAWKHWAESRALQLLNQLVEDKSKELAYCIYAKKRGAPETEWRQVKRLPPGERWRRKALAIADRYRRTDPTQVYRIGPPPLKP